MQEPYNPDSEQVDATSEVEIEGEKRHSLSELGDSASDQATTDVGGNGVRKEKNETTHPTEPDDATSIDIESKDAEERDGHSSALESLHDSDSAVSSQVVCGQMEAVSTDYAGGHMERANSSDCVNNDSAKYIKDKIVNFSSGQNACSINLSQLAEVVRSLDEDEFKFLFMSRGSALKTLVNAETLSGSVPNLFDVYGRMKEQLYLANLVKDVKSLQLAEEMEFQMSEANASVNELGNKNGMLAIELAQVRSELQVVVAEKEEIQKQFQISKAEVLDLSARADELQIKLNMSKEDLDNLSAELVGCRNLVSALEVEKENLSAKVDLLSKENKKLQEERGDFVLEIEKLEMELVQSKASLISLQSANQFSNDNLTSLNEERRKLQIEKEYFVSENDKLLAEVADCKKTIEALHAEKTNSNEILVLLEEKHSLLNDTGRLSAELRESKASVEALQMNVSETTTRVTTLMEETNKLEDEKQEILTKNEELLRELTESQNLVAVLQAQCSESVTDLKNSTLQMEQLTEENMHLKSSLELQMSKIKEFDNRSRSSSQSEELRNQFSGARCSDQGEGNVINDDGSSLVSREGDSVNFFSNIHKPSSDYEQNDILQFEAIQRYLNEAEGILEKLEKTVEEIHSNSASLRSSSGEVVTPGMSKLIHAFESNVHADDHLSEDRRPTENQVVADPCVLTKQQIGNVHALLKNVFLEAQKACKFFEGEMKNKLHTDTMLAECKAKYESLIEYTDHLEHENMVIMVLNETFRQYINCAKSKEGDFMALYDALQKNEVTLKAENSHFSERLSDFQTRTCEMQHQLNEMQQSYNEMASSASNQVEALKKEVTDRKSVLEEEWNSLVAEVMETLSKLDLSIVPDSPSLLTGREKGFDRLALTSHIATSVNNAIKLIESLHGQVEAARSDQEAAMSSFNEMNKRFDVLQGEKETVIGLIYKIYGNLTGLVNEMSDQVGEAEINTGNGKPVDPLLPSIWDTLLEQLWKLNSERLRIEAMNSELTSELEKVKDSNELNKSFLDSDSILKCVGYVERVIALDGVDINVDQPAICIQSLTHFVVEKYKEAVEQVKLFSEGDASKEKQMIDLQKQIDQLSFLFIQMENENFILKESLRKVKEDAVALNSQFSERVSETEQSNQRVASLREKLSIAVTRGKSLIVQRDSLKQSLAETSSELEKCSQELQLKDSRLHELEMKLKTYSEAGERMEALESELSYIRNSATVLRESFLLKDSVLQRIEEILEDLELPEHFHSKSILEKIDWLAKSVSGNSLHLTDWDQKSAVGGSYPESGTGVLDGWKEDAQPSFSSFEDLKVKYEDLQNKFYRLAEQNEMLEQSLMERNNLVQHWEAILDTIEMPSQLRSVEPDDKISWIAFALSEAQNYCNSLQQKSDNFEALFEESNRRLSDLEASYESAINEKEVLSRNLDTLTRDHEKISEKAAQFEARNDDLQHTINSLQEKLDEMLGIEERVHHILGEIQRLQDLVRDALQDNITDDQLYSVDGIKYLEQLLRMLIDKYRTLSLGEAINKDTAVERVLQEVDPTESEKGTSESRYDEDRDVAVLNRKLEDTLGDMMCLKEERDIFMEKNQSLVSEVEALNMNKKELQELLSQEELKNQSLVSKIEALTLNKKELQELLSQEVQKNQSLVSEVEALNMSMKELQELLRQEEPKNQLLVSEVDALNINKKELQELLNHHKLNNQSLVSEVEALNVKYKELQELLSEQELKNQSLVSEVEALNMNTKELQELLRQEEMKSTSLREKLNVAVRKGKSLVQHRDSLKQSIEELNMDVENLKSKIKQQENVISDYEERIKDESTFQEKIKSIESDSVLLQSRVAEAEYSLREKEHILAIILNSLDEIDFGVLSTIGSPVEKAKHVGKLCYDLQSALTSSEQEARKSKRAAELLLAELNEVQERNDGLQEELANALSEVTKLSKERDFADAAKNEAIANLEKLSAAYSEERQHHVAEFLVLKTSMEQLKVDLSIIRNSFSDVLLKDLEILHNLGASLTVCLESRDAPIDIALIGAAAPGGTITITSTNKAFMVELSSISEMLNTHSQLVHDEARHISEIVGGIHEEITTQKQSFESMKKDVAWLKSIEKEKDSELLQMRRYNTLLYEACTNSVVDIENWRRQNSGNNLVTSAPGNNLISSHSVGRGLTEDNDFYSEESIRSVCERLLLSVKDVMSMQMELAEGKQKDIKAAISDLQKELQEKDIQREKICRELVSQIKEAEAVANNYLEELQLAKVQVSDLQRYVKSMEEEQTKLEYRIKEMQDQDAAFADAQRRVKSLEDTVAAKEQENEALMQALDEEEAQMEEMSNKIGELETVLLQKNKDMENLEVSRGKALKKLSVTVSKFDELHNLSEKLLSEVESLQSQLQERDGEISFLRQEVTRCTNDALAASQMSSKRSSDEVHDLLTWLDNTISGVKANDANLDNVKVNQVHEYKECLQKQLMSIVSELVGLRVATQSKDLLLQAEKAKVEELMSKEDILESSLHEKDAQLAILRGAGDPGHVTSTSSEIVEIEPLNKWDTPGTVTSQVRSLRKTNNDHVAIAVDVNPDGRELEDEDDDKAHGFKSLTTSRIVPKFTRPLTDMVDGLWVSCDRALMRQPALRLGVILYWAVLHALLATFVV
ncbi:centromere protein F isoform X2 [Ipomoea triloba]|uniref:centromere protein F isoform X2 n=1 Tax=Ipomoea triloba TaxID=35885 RepID=UPI00125E3AAE|nr:centromere protein F isoform X2 [Ipomoea triloba]